MMNCFAMLNPEFYCVTIPYSRIAKCAVRIPRRYPEHSNDKFRKSSASDGSGAYSYAECVPGCICSLAEY
jgi:hypothetical protein